MEYATAKNASEIKLEGVTVVFDKSESGLQAVYFRDAKGNHCRVSLQSYSMKAEIPAPPKIEKRYVLRGEFPHLGKIVRSFEHKHEADDALRDVPGDLRDDFKIEQEEIEVPADGVAAQHTDDIPF